MKNKIKVLLGISLISVVTALYLIRKIQTKKSDQLSLSAQVLSNPTFTSNFNGYNYLKNRDVRNKYKAVQINIKNKSNHDYLLKTEDISLSLENSTKIEKMLRVRKYIAPLATASVACSLFIFGLGFAYVPSVVAGCTIGASTNLIDIEQSNQKLKNNIKNKSANKSHGILIPSCQTTSRIFFVKKDNLKPEFVVRLENIKTGNKAEYTVSV